MKITKNDIGRKVRLKNGEVRTINGITPNYGFLEISDSITNYESNGMWYAHRPSDKDIIAFVDDPQTLPIDFQVGDVVYFGGVLGVVKANRLRGSYPISVLFNNDSNSVIFTLDGKLFDYHTETLLKFVSRPKKKVKKEVQINVWYSPSLGFMSIENKDDTIAGDSQLITFKGEIEVEE